MTATSLRHGRNHTRDLPRFLPGSWRSAGFAGAPAGNRLYVADGCDDPSNKDPSISKGTTMSTRDRVKLTAHERHKLAGMEAALEAADPVLAQVLKGGGTRASAPASDASGAGRSVMHRLRPPQTLVKLPTAARSAQRSSIASLAHRALGRCARAATWPWTALVLVVLGASLAGTGAGLVSWYWLSVPGAAMFGVGCGLAILPLRRQRAIRRSRSGPGEPSGEQPGTNAYTS